jgi:hypothetical protein
MKLKSSRLIQLEVKADQGHILKFDQSLTKFSKNQSNLSNFDKKTPQIRNLTTCLNLYPVPLPNLSTRHSPSPIHTEYDPSVALLPVAPEPSPAAILLLSGAFVRRPTQGKPPPPRSSILQSQPLFFHAARPPLLAVVVA